MTQIPPNDRLLKSLAIALVAHPRATLKELAEAAGTSKATLHRLCGTRDNLVDLIFAQGLSALNQVIEDSDLEQSESFTALKRLIQGHLTHRELLIFMMFQYRPDSHGCDAERTSWISYVEALDKFFLKGQRAGLFRVDISAPVLTELFSAMLFGLVDAERRGRAASASSALVFEQFYLHGAVAHRP